MKLTSKWILWFVLVALWTSVFGGILCFNLFRSVFDKKLQNEMVAMIRFRAPQLVQALAVQPKGEATFNEADTMKGLSRNDERIKSLIYLNYDGSIRWHENGKFLRMSYEEYNNEVGFETSVVVKAQREKRPQAFLFEDNDGTYYDMAIPLIAKNDVVAGIVKVVVSRQEAVRFIHSSMVRYACISLLMMLIIGGVLLWFLRHRVVGPLVLLKDSVDAVSLNNLELSFPPRHDEVGDVGVAVEGLLDRIREDIKRLNNAEIMSLEKEQHWWKTILAVTVPKGSRAIVVDENNNILYTNFELKVPGKQQVHLLDLFDGKQQAIIQVIGEALENPEKVLRSTVAYKDVKFMVKVVQLPDDAGKNRIVLVLDPEK